MDVPTSATLSGRHVVMLGSRAVGKATLLNTIIGASHFAAWPLETTGPISFVREALTLTVDGVVYSNTPDWHDGSNAWSSVFNAGGELTILAVVELQRGALQRRDIRALEEFVCGAKRLGVDAHHRVSLVLNKCHPLVVEEHDADPAAWLSSVLPAKLRTLASHSVALPLLQAETEPPTFLLRSERDTLLCFVSAAPDLVLPVGKNFQPGYFQHFSSSSSDTDEYWAGVSGGNDGSRVTGGSAMKQYHGSPKQSFHGPPGSGGLVSPMASSRPGTQLGTDSSGTRPSYREPFVPAPPRTSYPRPVYAFPESRYVNIRSNSGEEREGSGSRIASSGSEDSDKQDPDHLRVECLLRIPRKIAIGSRTPPRQPQEDEGKNTWRARLSKFWGVSPNKIDKKAKEAADDINQGEVVNVSPRSIAMAETLTTTGAAVLPVQSSTPSASSSKPSEEAPLPLLENELRLVLHGSKRPRDSLLLIDKDATSASLSEWHAAHQLLMLAVEDGDLQRSPHRSPSTLFWWTQHLYAVASVFACASEAERQYVAACLLEASSVGVVENAESVIVGMAVTERAEARINTLEQAGLRTFRAVLAAERELECLEEAFAEYRKTQRNSQLLGIGLQLIPIVGGSVAGVVSAGAEIVSGLSVKDVADSVLGFGAWCTENGVGSTVRQRLFGSAAHATSTEVLESLPDAKREELEKVVCEGGLDVEELHTRLLCRSTALGAPEEADDAEVGESDGKSGSQKTPSSFRGMPVRRRMIGGMDGHALSCWWAAFVVMFDDEKQEEYARLGQGIHEFLEAQSMRPVDVVECGDMGAVVQAKVVEQLSAGVSSAMVLGAEIRLKRFMELLAST